MSDDRRLIEDYIPIAEISKESAREKSIRKGHISTLHLWWARRPLVAARAAVYASLIPAPETPQKRTALSKAMIDLCKWEADENTINKARKSILEAQRDRLGLPANTPLKEVPPPKVLDMFAGGGAIPLESLRLGCETYAVDLNPVAHIIELCTLVYPQKYGKQLATEVEKWGNWVIEKVRAEIGDLYPEIKVGEDIEPSHEQGELDLGNIVETKPKQLNISLSQRLVPVAYLWTRTVKCPNPECGADVPLVRQTWLCKKKKKYVALKITPNYQTKKVEFKVIEATTAKDLGFDPSLGSSRGNSTCHHCGTTIKSKPYIQDEGKAGRIGHQLMAIVCTTPDAQGKTYLSANDFQQYIPNEEAIKQRLDKLCQDTGLTIPDEPIKIDNNRDFKVPLYGMYKFKDLFTNRQLLSLMTCVKWINLAYKEIISSEYLLKNCKEKIDQDREDFTKAIISIIACGFSSFSNSFSTICRWIPQNQQMGSTFARQALPMTWDFVEITPFGGGSGNIIDYFSRLKEAIIHCSKISNIAQLHRQSSTSLLFTENYLDAIVTDPPYFDSVPYADLSDYFYAWLKRMVGNLYPEHFSNQLTPKKKEAIMEPSRHGGSKQKASQAYEDMMHQAFCEANRVLKGNGIIVIVYAHKTTSGWTTLIDSLRRAGFVITEAFPLDTEKSGRLIAQESAALASSIFLVARKRIHAIVGDYAMDVQPQLREIVQERVKTLMNEGVSGADLVIACVGAGLRAYTQYDTVELPNGEELEASTFLDEVQKEVAETILKEVLGCDQKGVSAVDKPTQYYILARYEYGEAVVEFDEANTLARGVGVELDGIGGLTDGKTALIKKDKNKIQLRNYLDRGNHETLGIRADTLGKQEFNQKSPPYSRGARGDQTSFTQGILGDEVDSSETNTKPKKGQKADTSVKRSTTYEPTLIDILHRLLWLAEHKPSEINNYLALAQPDGNKLKLVAQSLAGRALTGNVTPSPIDEGGKEENSESLETINSNVTRSAEQRAIDTLLASWKRSIEDNLFTRGGG